MDFYDIYDQLDALFEESLTEEANAEWTGEYIDKLISQISLEEGIFQKIKDKKIAKKLDREQDAEADNISNKAMNTISDKITQLFRKNQSKASKLWTDTLFQKILVKLISKNVDVAREIVDMSEFGDWLKSKEFTLHYSKRPIITKDDYNILTSDLCKQLTDVEIPNNTQIV